MPTMKEELNEIVATVLAVRGITDNAENRIAILKDMQIGAQKIDGPDAMKTMYIITIAFMILDLNLNIAYAPLN